MSFPTSYIKTEGAQVTRSADNASVDTLTPWFNGSEGTFYAEFFYKANEYGGIISGATQDSAIAYLIAGGSVRSFNGNLNTKIDVPGLVEGRNKLAVRYAPDGRTVRLNENEGSSTDNYLGDLSEIQVGFGRSSHLNNVVPVVLYFPRALTTTELEALTS